MPLSCKLSTITIKSLVQRKKNKIGYMPVAKILDKPTVSRLHIIHYRYSMLYLSFMFMFFVVISMRLPLTMHRSVGKLVFQNWVGPYVY
jgi:hypothetical protein